MRCRDKICVNQLTKQDDVIPCRHFECRSLEGDAYFGHFKVKSNVNKRIHFKGMCNVLKVRWITVMVSKIFRTYTFWNVLFLPKSLILENHMKQFFFAGEMFTQNVVFDSKLLSNVLHQFKTYLHVGTCLKQVNPKCRNKLG